MRSKANRGMTSRLSSRQCVTARSTSRPFRLRMREVRPAERRGGCSLQPSGAFTAASDQHDTLGLRPGSLPLRPKHASVTDRAIPLEKRMLDFAGAVGLLIFFLPLMALVALLITLGGGPAIFAHRRLGQGGRMFSCYKFRSMHVDAEERLTRLLEADPAAREEWARDHKLKHDPRVTPLGRFLRASSLDELPQLWNVLRGDMSLVGPRPIVMAEAPKYGRRIQSYFQCRPGLTGLWQVSGRNDVSYRRRVALDVLYARRRSFRLDLALLLATVPAVLLSRGSY